MPNSHQLSSFRASSVADQAESLLRRAIQRGSLSDPLPGEIQLAKELGISRTSLRIAMNKLSADGLITRDNGRRSRLSKSSSIRPKKAPPTVCLVCSRSRENITHSSHPLLLELRADIIAKDIRWEEIFDANLDIRNPATRLKLLVADRHHVCWVLFGCSAPVLKWFSEAQLSTVILGSCPVGVKLASVDANFRAVGWHAAGQLAKYGHRRIALIQPETLLTGDRDSRDGFNDYMSKQSTDTSIITISVERELTNLEAKIDHHLASPHPPTAFFGLHAPIALRTYLHLLRLGIKVPEDISLVSRDALDLFDTVAPVITRYRGSALQLLNRTARIAQSLLAGHPVPETPNLITPTFVAGQTLGICPPKPK